MHYSVEHKSKAENQSGLTHEFFSHISIWKYSNNVSERLIMIYIFGNFTPFPLQYHLISGHFRPFTIFEICGLDHSGSRPFIIIQF